MGVSVYRLKNSEILILCVLALLALGAVMVLSAGATVNSHASLGWDWTDKKQLIGIKNLAFALVAAVTFFLVGRFDYSWLGNKPKSIWQSPIFWALAIAGLACTLVLIPHVGLSVNGARRWLPLGFIQVQPSELAKWAVVLYLAWWLTHRPVDVDKFFTGLLPTLIPVAGICLLVVIQDFGTAALIAVASLAMLWAGKVRLRGLLLIIPPAICIAAWFILHREYRVKRLTIFLNPYAAPQKEGYHMIQSLLSFATGGVGGRGLGNGIQKLGYLPEDTTDFIFSVICEELGIFGALMVVALYAGILYIAWQAVKEKRDDFGRLLALGIGAMVGLQAVINIAVATVSVPTKGLSLPLISAGGSGLVITSAAMGLLLSVVKFGKTEEAPKPIESPPPLTPFDGLPMAS